MVDGTINLDVSGVSPSPSGGDSLWRVDLMESVPVFHYAYACVHVVIVEDPHLIEFKD
jgi:hypothetical protein